MRAAASILLRAACAVPLVAVVACGDDAPTPYTLTFAGDATKLVLGLAQDGDGVWQPITLDAAGQAQFEVTRGYHGVLRVCSLGNGRPGALFADFSAGDPGRPLSLCPASATNWGMVTGAVRPMDAEVFIGASPNTSNGPGRYRAVAPRGPQDLIARAAGRMLIRHDEDFTVDHTLDLDVTVDGFDLGSAALTVTGAGVDPVTTFAELHTNHDTYVGLDGVDGVVPLVPAARRHAGDRMVIGATATATDGSRSVQRKLVDDGVVPLELAPAPTLAVARTGATWSGAWDYVSIGLSNQALVNGQITGTSIYASYDRAWLEHGGDGAATLMDPSTLPGWDPSWPTLTGEVRWSLGVSSGDRAGDLVSAGRRGKLTW